MGLSMYEAAIPPMAQSLSNLVGILAKGTAHAQARQLDEGVLLQSRLYPDMFPLVRQVQIASDIARRGAARLAGLEAPAMADEETSFAELVERLEASIAYLNTLTPEQIEGSEHREISLPVRERTLTMNGRAFLLQFVLPNVYFHVTTAYDILRHCGVELGKIDYLGDPTRA